MYHATCHTYTYPANGSRLTTRHTGGPQKNADEECDWILTLVTQSISLNVMNYSAVP